MKDRNDLENEEICGFTVVSKRKKMWVYELDMLDMLDTACKENDIKYYLLYGSAIGAVRHHGFIPWDDDIDIGMTRENFEKFRKCISKYLPEYIEVQYGLSEHGFDPLMRIRDARTTGIIKSDLGYPGNKGIFIEVYPFDYVDNNMLRKIQILLTGKIGGMLNIAYGQKKGSVAKTIISKMLPKKFLYALYNWVCTLQNGREREYIDTICLPFYAMLNQQLYRREDMIETIYVDFEYTKVCIPKEYHKCLSTSYGDYMKLPPLEERGMHHEAVVFYDPDKPYSEYEGTEIIAKYFAGDSKLSLIHVT